MRQYLDLLKTVLEKGVYRKDRTGTGCLSMFGHQMRFDLEQGFPLITTKKLHLRSIIYELLWFLKGDTNIAYLKKNGIRIWDEWADENGDLGPVYGKQWRAWSTSSKMITDQKKLQNQKSQLHFESIDQISRAIEMIRKEPNSRRIIVSAWNPSELDQMALPPCHCLFQFLVLDGKLHCQLYQRSADIFLGVPFNIASYSLLLLMMAQITDLKPGAFVHVLGDAHLYSNHIEQAKQQLTRHPRELPEIQLNPDIEDLFAFDYPDFKLENYDPWPHIRAEIAV